MRRKRLDKSALTARLDDFGEMAIIVDQETSTRAWKRTAGIALKHDLTLYDAAYLELALRLDGPLLSVDSDLLSAAAAERVQIL